MNVRRKLWIVLSLISYLMVSCAGGAPNLILSELEVDLGEVVNGEVRTLEIPIRNAGDEALVIEAVTTSCGCTSARVEPATIRPGGAGTLIVTYDSGAHGPEANGLFVRQVFIASNDPDQAEAEFRIIAEVLPPES
ncbi:MAG: DUF1573 domain-containing protein [Anaerolineales bacterium]|nr:DUF1573 domain-containing protein [Anaerolineales bacterium]